MILRPYQETMLEALRARMRAGVRRLLLVAPCGAGKTVMMAAMARGAVERGYRVHLWAHRKELIEQSVQTFIEAADIDTGIIAAGYPTRPSAPVQVCSVQTLARRASRVAVPDIVIVDEAHHQASASYSKLAAQFKSRYFIGVTASPIRLDGRGLKPHFDEIIAGPSTADLIAQGFLSPYTLYAPPKAVDFSKVHRVAGDYDKKEVNEEMEGSTVVGDAVSHYRQHCPDARALVFAWSIEASERIASQFVAAGVPAQHVDGETPRFVRTQAINDFRAGSLRVICSVDIFGEGVDLIGVDAVFLLRPTQSLGVFIQQVGRGLRLSPGKTHVKIFDHVNNWERHGLPDDPREWSLEGREKRTRESVAMGRRCEQCFGVSPIGATVCRYCGHVFPVQQREIEQVEGTLQTMDIEALRAYREQMRAEIKHCKTMKDYKRVGRALGYKPGWAWHAMYEREEKARTLAARLSEEDVWSQPS